MSCQNVKIQLGGVPRDAVNLGEPGDIQKLGQTKQSAVIMKMMENPS